MGVAVLVAVFVLVLLASKVDWYLVGEIVQTTILVLLCLVAAGLVTGLLIHFKVWRVWSWWRKHRQPDKPVKPVDDEPAPPPRDDAPARPEPSPTFAPNPVVTPDVYGNNPTRGTFKPALESASPPVQHEPRSETPPVGSHHLNLVERTQPPTHDPRLIVSLQEAVDHRIVEGLTLSALRKASQRAGFPAVAARERRGNTGAPEKLFYAVELAAWSAARMSHHAAPR